jgi:hypothetical protein
MPALRSYQSRIVETAMSRGNILVVLPTGSGKTLIAAELMMRQEGSSLFLVPKRVLVPQQAAAIRAHTNLRVGEFMGGEAIPRGSQVIVTTPKAFQVAQAKEASFAWGQFSLVVFDEVHHVLKDHPYRKLALLLRRSGATPLVVGLSASLTFAVTDKGMKASITRLCDELSIRACETAGVDELQAAGYHAAAPLADVLPNRTEADGVPDAERKPHLMHSTFFARVSSRKATSLSLMLVDCIREFEQAIAQIDPAFSSPLSKAGLAAWGEYAFRRGAISPLYAPLQHLYEALRLLVASWEEDGHMAVEYLRMYNEQDRQHDPTLPTAVRSCLRRFWDSQPTLFPQFEDLKAVLLQEQLTLSPSGHGFRGILFVRQRISTYIIAHVVRSDPRLSSFLPAVLHATNSPVTPLLTMSLTQQREALEAFRLGRNNLLISTEVAEEGLDVPAANCVIRFDEIVHSVSLAQSRGRGREANSRFVVMRERIDRPVSLLERIEQEQLAVVRAFSPPAFGSAAATEATAQKSREHGAAAVLNTDSLTCATVLAVLNLYCKKTKVDLVEAYEFGADGLCQCRLTYHSVLREVEKRGGSSRGKKEAKQQAALLLVAALRFPESSSN